MYTFFGSVYKLVSIPLQGVWEISNNSFNFNIEDKPVNLQTPGHTLDMVLYINEDKIGVVNLKFPEEGICYMNLDGEDKYKIHAMYRNAEGDFLMTLIDKQNNSLVLKKKEVA